MHNPKILIKKSKFKFEYRNQAEEDVFPLRLGCNQNVKSKLESSVINQKYFRKILKKIQEILRKLEKKLSKAKL